MNIELLKEKHKMNKWWFFIPVIGTIIYVLRFEFAVNKLILEDDKKFKKIRKYKSWANLISIVIALPFIVSFFVLRNHNGFGSWPWFFWVGLALGLVQNIQPVFSWYLYKIGFKKFEANENK